MEHQEFSDIEIEEACMLALLYYSLSDLYVSYSTCISLYVLETLADQSLQRYYEMRNTTT